MQAIQQLRERRNRLIHTVSQLLRERQQLMVAYSELAALKPFRNLRSVQDKLRNFCQLMVDYTALGHFEIYQRIIEGQERRKPVKLAAARVYPAIAETTDVLVDFNDKYESLDDAEDAEGLSVDLSKLGEAFAVRIDLEDQILDSLTGKAVTNSPA